MAGKGKPGPAPTGATVKPLAVALRPPQIEFLRFVAAQKGVSVSAVVRVLIDDFIREVSK